MTQKLSIGLLLTIVLYSSCNTNSNTQPKASKDPVNRNAPFYTHQVPAGHPRISKQYDSSKILQFWPFILYTDGSYMIAAEIGRDTTLETFESFFDKYGGDGTGYNWAALLKVILKKENPDLIKHLDFDPEAGGFYLFADSEDSQKQFVDFASKAFKDKSKLIGYLTGPDKAEALEYNP